jgi:hypothetical protein
MAQRLNADIGRRLIADLMMDYGFTKWQAAALVGNFAHETGNFKFMQEQNIDTPGGLGWAQWTGPRRKQFEAYLKENNYSLNDPEGNYRGNYGFLMKELTGPYRSVLNDLLKTENARTANSVVYENYETPQDVLDETYKSRREREDYTMQAHAMAYGPGTPQAGWIPEYVPDAGYGALSDTFLGGPIPDVSPVNGPGFGSVYGPEASYPGQIDGTQSTNVLRGGDQPVTNFGMGAPPAGIPAGWYQAPGGSWYDPTNPQYAHLAGTALPPMYGSGGGATNFGMGAQDVSGGVEPAGFGDFGMEPIGGNPRWDVNTPEGWTRINEPWKPELQPGGIWYATDDELWGAPEGWEGGGDWATQQGHTDYMNAARAAKAKEAQYQAGVQAQRAETDASIAQNYATSNSYNPQYNQQGAFNQNVANQNNAAPGYAAYDPYSTQYQSYGI